MSVPEVARNSSSAAVDPRVLAEWLTDFPSFCALVEVIDFNDPSKRVPMRLTGIQRAYNAARSPRDVVLKARKVYMSTLEYARDWWWFLTKPGTQTVVVCQTEIKSRALRRVAREMRVLLDSLRSRIPGIGSREHERRKFDVETDTEFVWRERGSSLVIVEAGASVKTATKGGRGGVIHRLHATETAFWEHGAETLAALLGAMPPRGGEAVIESTPNGATGYYYERWKAAEEGTGEFRPCFYPWYLHEDYRTPLDPGEEVVPTTALESRLMAEGVSAEAIKWHRKQVATFGPDKTAQEYPSDPATCFLLSGREYFDSATTTALLANAAKPVSTIPVRESGAHAEIRIWGLPVRSADYCVAADTSEGTGGDASAAVVREVGTGVEVAKLSGQVKPGELALVLVRLALTYRRDAEHGALIVVERNGPGLTTLDRLINVVGYKRVFHDRDGKPGWHTNVASRPAALAGLEQAQREGTWRTLDRPTLEQMRVFVWREKPSGAVKAEAAPGEKDDLIMAEAICWDVLRRPVALVVRDDAMLEAV